MRPAGWSESSLGTHVRRYVAVQLMSGVCHAMRKCTFEIYLPTAKRLRSDCADALVKLWGFVWKSYQASESVLRFFCLLMKYSRFSHSAPYMNRNARKCTFWKMRPAKIQISLRICAVWSESSLGVFLIAEDAKFLHDDNEDWSDCSDAQADLSLRSAKILEGTSLHVVAQIPMWLASCEKSFLEYMRTTRIRSGHLLFLIACKYSAQEQGKPK